MQLSFDISFLPPSFFSPALRFSSHPPFFSGQQAYLALPRGRTFLLHCAAKTLCISHFKNTREAPNTNLLKRRLIVSDCDGEISVTDLDGLHYKWWEPAEIHISPQRLLIALYSLRNHLVVSLHLTVTLKRIIVFFFFSIEVSMSLDGLGGAL